MFSWLEKAAFVSRPDGRVHFYPFGYFASGYIVEDSTSEATLRRKWRVLTKCVNFIGIAGMIFLHFVVGTWSIFAFLPVVLFAQILFTRRLARGMRPSQIRQTFRENQAIMWSGVGWPFYLFMGFLVVMLLGSILALAFLPKFPPS